MPFDNTNLPEEVRILDEMARLLAEPGAWCKMKYAFYRANGQVSMCLLGALNYVDHRDYLPIVTREFFNPHTERVLDILVVLLPARGLPDQASLSQFNDSDQTKHADVLALIDLAREKAMETV